MRGNMTKLDTTFEEIQEDNGELYIPKGDNEQVLGLAAFQNMGKAIIDDDLYPPGNYLLHEVPNMMEVRIVKDSKVQYYFVVNVYDHVLAAYKKELDIKKKKSATAPKGEKIWYDAPIWVVWDLALNQQVHPFFDEKEFEKALWENYPELWLDKSKAPRH